MLEGRRPRGTLIVSSLVNDLIGLSAYMDERALQRFLGEGDTITGVAVASDRDPAPELYAALKHAPKVQTVTVTTAALRMFEETTSRFVLVFSGILTLFGAVIAVGVVYNHTRVALQERAWELASLRVLGFTRGEVAGILFGEIAVSLAVGIPLQQIWGIVWGVAGFVALVAGLLWGSRNGVQFSLTFVALKALPVLILGGFTSVPGAIIGGLIIGASEKLAEVYLGPFVGGGIEGWFPYVLALLFLLVRPEGLFGEKIIRRI